MISFHHFILLGGIALAVTALAEPQRTTPPPIEHFFAEPQMRQLQISPDGKYLAFLTTLGNDKVGIALMHLDTGKVEPLVGANDENIDFFFWKGGDCIVYAGDLGGNESRAIRSISIKQRKVVALAESYRDRVADRANFAHIVDQLRFDPNHILVFGNKEIASYTVGYWKLHVRTGRRTAMELLDHRETGTVFDNRGFGLARSRYSGGKIIFEVRPGNSGPYRKVAEFPDNDPRWAFISFAADNETLYLISNEDDYALHTINVRTGQLSEPIVRVDGELDALLFSNDQTKLYGVSYTTDRTRYHWFDPERARLQATIDASLPGTFNPVVSSTTDEQLLVIRATSDRDPGTYYLFDRRVPRLMQIGRVNNHLRPEMLRPMEPIKFTARDGLTIHGYLTRPAGYENRPAPLIVFPHGGPFGVRDYWGYDRDVQFLASRGYAVLQINYRGSGGYGKSFTEAGKREWGGKMQDDLTDGVRWAIDQQLADPDRIAIYGASYGGYAALAGVVFTPELYRCAINYVGVSDLGLITSWSYRFGNTSSEIFYREWIGDDKAYLQSRSPINFVDRIQVPTLHAYGFNDPRVEIKHWTRLEPKLKQYGKVYEAIIETREGHGFNNEAARIAFYRRVEAFLERHMQPRAAKVAAEPADAAEISRATSRSN